ncbi:hypothetical protein [Rhodanobacter denitrificans]|uniref:hypothetical protein n=1 Tax=Rhodanobacter denitrificans TaxID=666685 RepID=UPI001F1A2E01|nr:hypothetical protein [Rhodanobacter denitrificans]UJJ60001.1 hypothetical protein LRK55_07695 [Rhodanobacter denitrificans]
MEVVGSVSLVVLGAILGFVATKLSSWQESRSRRNLLIGMFKYELRRVKNEFPTYDESLVFHRDTLRFASIEKLIEGNCLSYKREGKLIQELLFFRIAVARYNDFVSVSNYTQNCGSMSNEAHREVFNIIADYHILVRAVLSG